MWRLLTPFLACRFYFLGSIGDAIGKAAGAVGDFITGGVGSAIGAGLDFVGGVQRNEAQLASAREQMDFQRSMSNTAYRRAMRDMRKAGLNPILAYKQGGASTPGGAQAMLLNPLGEAVNTGFQGMQAMASAENLEAQTAKVREELKPISKQIGSVKAESWLKSVQRYIGEMEYNKSLVAFDILKEELKLARRNAQIKDIEYTALSKGLKAMELDHILKSDEYTPDGTTFPEWDGKY